MKKCFIFFLTVIFLVTINYLLVPKVNGQSSDALSLGISPAVIEINADPPANIEAKIVIQNLGETPQHLDISFKSFRPSPSGNGEIEFLQGTQIQGPDPLILQKTHVLEGNSEVNNISLLPFEEKLLTLKIDIERGAPHGDYYFSVVFTSKPESEQTGISGAQVPGGIGTNVILSVGKKGDIRGHIDAFSTPFFRSSGPVPITLRVKNDGEQYFIPTGKITIKNVFGKELDRIDLLPQYILSGSERYLIDQSQASPSAKLSSDLEKLSSSHGVIVWPENFLFGLYTANLNLKLSPSGPSFQTKVYFLAVPLYFVFASSFFAFILLGIYLKVKKKI